MTNKKLIEITILVSNHSGILSSLMIKAGAFGLIYLRQHTEKLNDEESRIVLSFNGELDFSLDAPINSFEELDDVIKVEKIEILDAVA